MQATDLCASLRYTPAKHFQLYAGIGVRHFFNIQQAYSKELLALTPDNPDEHFETSLFSGSNFNAMYPFVKVSGSYAVEILSRLSLALSVAFQQSVQNIVPHDLTPAMVTIRDYYWNEEKRIDLDLCSYSFRNISAGLELRYQL